jgi:hypothetical protein
MSSDTGWRADSSTCVAEEAHLGSRAPRPRTYRLTSEAASRDRGSRTTQPLVVLGIRMSRTAPHSKGDELSAGSWPDEVRTLLNEVNETRGRKGHDTVQDRPRRVGLASCLERPS